MAAPHPDTVACHGCDLLQRIRPLPPDRRALSALPQNTSANEVQVDEFNRWASPLQNDISRVVAENLGALLGAPRVTQTLGVERATSARRGAPRYHSAS